LKYAAANGDIEMVKMLLEYSPQFDPIDENGRTPLYHAIDSLSDKMFSSTPTDNEIIQKFEEVIALLIEHGADINSRDTSDQTPLLRTILIFVNDRRNKDQQLEHIRFLLKMGADPDLMSDEDNALPLYTVARNRRYDVVQVLLEGGADPWLMPSHSYPFSWRRYNLLYFARQVKDDKLYDLLYPYMKERYERTNKEVLEVTKRVLNWTTTKMLKFQ